MNGNNFRNEYKTAMEQITPNSELLTHISQQMKQAKPEPIQLPVQNKSFYARHRAILTAAATFAVVIGIFAVGAVIMSHFDDVNLTGSASTGSAGGYFSSSDEEIAMDAPIYNQVNGIGDGCIDADGVESGSIAAPGALKEPGLAGGSTSESASEPYSNSFLRELAEKARNSTLTVDDIGENITVQGEAPCYQVFCSFNRNGISYALTADFEETNCGLKAVSLYITESEITDADTKLDLINNSDYLEDYFARNATEEIN